MMKKILLFALFIFLTHSLFLLPFLTHAHAAGVNGDTHISEVFDGSPIVIKTTDRLAGAIESLTWKGKEFEDGSDHGRQIQYAWFLNNQGECNNPTEAGSRANGLGNISSSILKKIQAIGNQVTTETQVAYWLGPGEVSAFCGSTQKSVATSIVSHHTVKKTVTIGWQGLSNVIEMVADITIPQQTSALIVSAPATYLLDDFSAFWTYNPARDVLTDVTSKLAVTSWDQNDKLYSSYLPAILSTYDKQFAFGVYAPDLYGENEGKRYYDLNDFLPAYPIAPNTIHLDYQLGPTTQGKYRYRTYFIIGSLDQVRLTLKELYNRLPTNLENPVEGNLDSVNCTYVSGWSGYLGHADIPNRVSLYSDGPIGTGQLLETVYTTIQGEKAICDALNGENCAVCPSNTSQCLHRFGYPLPMVLKDGRSHDIYAYGLSPSGKLQVLGSTPLSIKCMAGDLDNNNNVDIYDYNQLITDFGKTGFTGFTPADIDINGKVDIYDYNILVGNFGK